MGFLGFFLNDCREMDGSLTFLLDEAESCIIACFQGLGGKKFISDNILKIRRRLGICDTTPCSHTLNREPQFSFRH